MSEPPHRPQLTSLLSNSVLSRLERMRINSRRRFTSKSRGEHLSGKGGASTDFSDYRDYVPGDDVRFVDWNIFARLNRPYMKLYHQEEEMHVAILVDASSSMAFDDKLERACQIAAAFGVLGLLGTERVSAYVFNSRDERGRRFPPSTGRASMLPLFSFLERQESGGDAPVEVGVEEFLRRHVGRGIVYILSDFLTFGDVRRALNLLFSAGLETNGVQMLGPAEIDPDLTGDLRLVDCESRTHLDVSSVGSLLDVYQEYREGYERELASLCRQRGGRFVSVSSEAPVEWVLFDLLRRRGWIG